MDPIEIAHWTDAVYSAIVCSLAEEEEFREFCEVWFKDLVNHRGREKHEVVVDGNDRS